MVLGEDIKVFKKVKKYVLKWWCLNVQEWTQRLPANYFMC